MTPPWHLPYVLGTTLALAASAVTYGAAAAWWGWWLAAAQHVNSGEKHAKP